MLGADGTMRAMTARHRLAAYPAMKTAPLIWVIDTRSTSVATCWSVLDSGERRRAGQYLKDVDRRNFIATRAALRHALASIADIEPAAFRFGTGAWGKPFIAAPACHATMQFSVAHTGSIGLIAAAPSRRIGIDVEQRCRVDDRYPIAKQVLGAELAISLDRLDESARDQAFLRCWTVAEAFAKATGLGLAGFAGALPLRVSNAEVIGITDADAAQAETGLAWSIVPLDLGADYAEYIASLIVECAPGETIASPVAAPWPAKPGAALLM
jgi:4'-phosphopantetheinyl transferase